MNVEKKAPQHRMAYGPPPRVWYPTADGWASREWHPGEQAEYVRDVLGWVKRTEGTSA